MTTTARVTSAMMHTTVRDHFPPRGADHFRRLPDAELPLEDPHGTPWCVLTADELITRSGWCMLPDHHEALRRAIADNTAGPDADDILPSRFSCAFVAGESLSSSAR